MEEWKNGQKRIACNIGAGGYTASGVISTIDLTEPQGKIK